MTNQEDDICVDQDDYEKERQEEFEWVFEDWLKRIKLD